MNVKLLRKIRDEILKKPLRLDMGNWVNRQDDIAPCNTTACIAGWAVILDKQNRYKTKWTDEATVAIRDNQASPLRSYFETTGQDCLDLTRIQAQRLFYCQSWPAQFSKPWTELHENTFLIVARGRDNRRKLMARRKMAKLTAKRIDHFIKTKGDE